MKRFTKIGTASRTVGDRFKHKILIKRYQTEDGLKHEFTTFGGEGTRSGAVIAITPDHKVVTCYQFRAGPERWMYELPGGNFNDGEAPETAALRELREETGYVPGKVEYLGESCRGGYINTVWHYYLATDCVVADDGAMLDEEESDQGVEVRLISIAELIDNAKHDQMTDPHAVLMAYDKLQELKGHKV